MFRSNIKRLMAQTFPKTMLLASNLLMKLS